MKNDTNKEIIIGYGGKNGLNNGRGQSLVSDTFFPLSAMTFTGSVLLAFLTSLQSDENVLFSF